MDCEDRQTLRTRIAALRAETAALEARLASVDRVDSSSRARDGALDDDRGESASRPMPLADYRRYGRQMILKPVGLPGQLALRRARVLVVGAGGLGCPALLYLATAGVGRIGIVDHDTVELSNLHRQVLHTESSIGLPKAESARRALIECVTALLRRRPRRRNATIDITAHVCAFDELVADGYDLVLDCTDNASTRHRINAACVDRGITLVSGAAIRTDGQLSVWNLALADGARGPCYACVFPPSSAVDEASQRCEDEGVLGPVTGVIGTLMACEAIRLLTGSHGASGLAAHLTAQIARPSSRSSTRSATRPSAR